MRSGPADHGSSDQGSESPVADVSFYRGLVESAPDALVVVDEAGRIRLVNQQTEALFGYTREELVGEAVEVLVPERHQGAHPGHRAGYVTEPRMRPMGAGLDLMAQRKDGTEFPVDISLSPLHTDEGLVVSAVIRDITERQRAAAELQRANAQLTETVRELERRNHEMALINELSDLLQSCLEQREANEVVERFARQLFPELSGALFLQTPAGPCYELAASWGATNLDAWAFDPTECWALRRGQLHLVETADGGPVCPHLHGLKAASMCVPMSAQGSTLGVFHLHTDGPAALSDTTQRLASTVADHLSLALANFQLRETLHRQSVRDELTGLYNRRYLEESLDREIARTTRSGHPLSVVVLDLDHFKAVNDTLGHAAGDDVLVAVAEVLANHVRGGDLACRYGGDEFALMLTECDLETATERTEQLRHAINTTRLPDNPALRVPPTVSAGVAAFPTHATSPVELIGAADAALYTSKRHGRNRTVTPSLHDDADAQDCPQYDANPDSSTDPGSTT